VLDQCTGFGEQPRSLPSTVDGERPRDFFIGSIAVSPSTQDDRWRVNRGDDEFEINQMHAEREKKPAKQAKKQCGISGAGKKNRTDGTNPCSSTALGTVRPDCGGVFTAVGCW
jgi:hypothetical protein